MRVFNLEMNRSITDVFFYSNILFLILCFIGFPFFFLNYRDIFLEVMFEDRLNVIKSIFFFLNILSFANWIYCLVFLFKNDRYSKSIIPLFFINALYAPIYYYRVIIKKRPLRNKINEVDEFKLDEILEEET